ncbi:hypothetical protein A2574_02975 [Candidatus Shapirobacteria bacterium RIFOXYD1_FULL_38_32]|uniref:Uncharacterized protein n=2 Tax=Bacteria candidate phyla TaxID=1783234 RepID=A0A1F7SSY2_9BACT|nr:MAG: Type IV secretory pathway VirB4 protein [candidate division WWE3 bacterium GW2011_GWF1_42_14]OGL56523.1 MAG: hypothetical protein A2195_00585 [Candidatus Shapirobacteria bacterium RIFOXYA1_FULL_39_17]OGL56919.1 MAG: hypothetical protein A2367_02980 [Candidatus Shapirobacteria bacterium RIFOXYB1_FULL_38_38]OGL57795.1 MAG: hypothetical protein A2410_03195 [Candidatus Shapirobacteria bacterium RIFOXYC1_FULL_38_24]OGL58563.1 MAG: hypothetical protein A2574_02975 [Candidatus Shapirobacteria 
MNWLFTKTGIAPARHQIQIKQIADNILVLPNHEYRIILETSSINFELKSEEEQDVIIDSFQNFLNSLPCAIQILVRVREIDIDKYVEDIERLKDQETEVIYQKQIENYSSFVKKLVSGNTILSRRFYIILPYHHTDRSEDWSLIKEHLNLNRDIVTKGLERMQMRVRPLTSIEMINLFYAFYNQDSLKTQPITKQSLEALFKHDYV